MALVGLYILAYLLGAVPFGYLVGLSKGIDITKTGSGNIGATNAYRALGRTAGLSVFALDVAKGAVCPLLVRYFVGPINSLSHVEAMNHAVLLGVAAVLGHSFSPFLRFKGGKGVATGLGAILGTAPVVGLVGFGVFLLVVLISRIVSVSSILGSASVVVAAVVTKQPPLLIWVYGLVVTFVIVRHVPNMKRFFRGEEKRFDFKKKKPTEPDKSDESYEPDQSERGADK